MPKASHGEILPLYRRWLAEASFGLERPAGRWAGFYRGQRGNVNVTVTGFYRGRHMVGYVACDQAADAVRVPELVALDAAARLSMFTWLARQCRDKFCEKILFTLPADDPASRMAQDFGATFTRLTKANGGGMMRILNLSSTLAVLRPELATLWGKSSLGAQRLELTLVTELGTAGVRLAGSRPSSHALRARATVPQDRLIELISGYARPAEVAVHRGVSVPPRLLPALECFSPALRHRAGYQLLLSALAKVRLRQRVDGWGSEGGVRDFPFFWAFARLVVVADVGRLGGCMSACAGGF